MASLRKKGKTWYYRYTDADGVARELPGCSDKRETEAMLADALAESRESGTATSTERPPGIGCTSRDPWPSTLTTGRPTLWLKVRLSSTPNTRPTAFADWSRWCWEQQRP